MMKIKKFKDESLAHYSYAIFSEGELALVDPSRSSILYTSVWRIVLLYMLQDNCSLSLNQLNTCLHWKNLEHILELKLL